MSINLSHPTVWGPFVWNTLHLLASQFKSTTEEDRMCWVNVIKCLPGILPCKECREHFREYLSNNPIDISVAQDANTLSHWLWKAHEHVNSLTGKKPKVTYSMLTKQLKIPQPSIPASIIPQELAIVTTQPQQTQQKFSGIKSSYQPKPPTNPATVTVSPLLNKVQQNIMNQLHTRENATQPTIVNNSQSFSSGKPPLRIENNQVVRDVIKQIEPSKPTSTPQQPPSKPRKQPPKAVPIQQQQKILAQRNVAKQMSVHNQPPPQPVHYQQPKPIHQQQPTSTAIVPIQNNGQTAVRRTIASLMKGRVPSPTQQIKPVQNNTTRQSFTVQQMADALQKNGIKIRGIVTRTPVIQPGIKPAALPSQSRALMIPSARSLSVPSTLGVPRTLATLPGRKKCNCGRK